MALSHSPKIVTDGLEALIDAGDPKCLTASDSITTRIYDQGNVRSGSGITFSDGETNSTGVGGNLSWPRSINWAETSFTFSGWGNRDNLDDDKEGRIVDVLNAGNGHLRLTLKTNPDLRFRPTAGGGNNLISATKTINAGEWYNLVVVKSGETSGGSASYVMYLNGEQIATNTSSALATDSNFTRYRLMRSADDDQSSISWLGKFGPFYSYTRALTASEVLQNYNAQKGRFS
tara:strand:+ start:1063 stop:1758 length:696 start_codon:yes stop_codon:yes gene_type:complete